MVDLYLFYSWSFDRYIKQCKCLKIYDLDLYMDQGERYVILLSSALSIEMFVVSRQL